MRRTLNLTAPICDSGYGQVAVNLMAALDRMNVSVALFPIGPVSCESRFRGLIQGGLERAAQYDPQAPSLRIFHQFSLAQHVGKGMHVGFPIFELDTFTDIERHHLESQDFLFVCSEWAAQTLKEAGIRQNAYVVPLGVDPTVFFPAPLNAGPTTFAHISKCEVRKGTYEVIEAFSNAFTPNDDVRLILHCDNPFMHPEQAARFNKEWREFALSMPMAGKTVITNGRLGSQEEVAQLMLRADCGLFPSRGEGWNLELSEMLAMGRHCISTDYSGHTEYVTNECCRLIPFTGLETAFDGVYFHGQGRWMEFGSLQKEILISHMRAVHAEKMAGKLAVNEAGVKRMRDFTWDNSARRLWEILS